MKSGEKLGYQARTWDKSHMSVSSETIAIDLASFHFPINSRLLIKNNTPNTALKGQSANIIENNINTENTGRVFKKTEYQSHCEVH